MSDDAPRTLDQIPVTELPSIGTALADKLAKIGVRNVQDVLFRLPFRYEDRTKITPIGEFIVGERALGEGEITASGIRFGRRRRRSLSVQVADDSGVVQLRFFHFNKQQQGMLRVGARLRFIGELKARGEIYHPEYTVLFGDDAPPPEQTLTPVYPSTEGVSQYRWRSMREGALHLLGADSLRDWLTPPLPKAVGDISLEAALRYLHAPPPEAPLEQLAQGLHPSQRRLAFEELLAHHMSLRLRRDEILSTRAPALPTEPARESFKNFLESFGFRLTEAQRKVWAEIGDDLRTETPMLRLLQGDVGSGKTVVAALAALQAVANGHQAAIMAPTEVLAEQHYLNFDRWMMPLSIPLAWLSGRIKGVKRQRERERVAIGEAKIVIGTHALIEDEVHFSRLGLIVVDEQHRFGVRQRLKLREKGAASGRAPHQLIMTATPIPRTLIMTSYADLDTSVIDQLPPGRKKITTTVVAQKRRPQVIERVRAACADGRRAYWVCPLIEESEAIQCQAAESVAAELREALPNISVGLVHGRHKPKEKTAAMEAFKSGATQLLVATTVIEVGVDVPEASLMIIENPERLGLAQLHQLRGRIGRGSEESFCLLMHAPSLSEQGRERLSIIRDNDDGFAIAEEDLRIRGPGEMLGTRQAGELIFRIADVRRDEDLLEAARAYAGNFQQKHADRVPLLIRRWIADDERYGEV